MRDFHFNPSNIGKSFLDQFNWMSVKNNSGEVIPAFSLYIQQAEWSDGNIRYLADKQSDIFFRTIGVSGPADIPIDGYGRAFPPGLCIFKGDDGSYPVDAGVGPKLDEWTGFEHYPCCLDVIAEINNTDHWYLGNLHPIETLLVVTNEDLSPLGNAEADIYAGTPGSETAVSSGNYVIDVQDSLMVSGDPKLESGAKLNCHFRNGSWYADGNPNYPKHTCIGILDGSLSVGSSATVSVYQGSTGTESDTTVNITAYDWLMKTGATAIASGKKVLCRKIDGIWYVTEAECA